MAKFAWRRATRAVGHRRRITRLPRMAMHQLPPGRLYFDWRGRLGAGGLGLRRQDRGHDKQLRREPRRRRARLQAPQREVQGAPRDAGLVRARDHHAARPRAPEHHDLRGREPARKQRALLRDAALLVVLAQVHAGGTKTGDWRSTRQSSTRRPRYMRTCRSACGGHGSRPSCGTMMVAVRAPLPLVGCESRTQGSEENAVGRGAADAVVAAAAERPLATGVVGAVGALAAVAVAAGMAGGGRATTTSSGDGGGSGGVAPGLVSSTTMGSIRRMRRLDTIRSAGMLTPTPERTPMRPAVILRR